MGTGMHGERHGHGWSIMFGAGRGAEPLALLWCTGGVHKAVCVHPCGGTAREPAPITRPSSLRRLGEALAWGLSLIHI